jgi:nicotinate-nucleotide adenylyltransferase
MGVVKVGVMGGTFDPIHNGHLAIAKVAREKLVLDKVIFVPAGQPWLKSQALISPAPDRLEMVRLAVKPYPGFSLSRVEIDRQGPSYSVDTVAELKASLGTDTRLFFLIGWDNVMQLPKWYQVARLLDLCDFVAMPRPGCPRPDLAVLEKDVPGITGKVILLDSPQVDISATDIRERVAGGLSISPLVPPEVARYIREKRLYSYP